MKTMPKVIHDKRSNKSDVLSGNAMDEIEAKKKALRPKAESGKAVALPRWFGQFNAAEVPLTMIWIGPM